MLKYTIKRKEDMYSIQAWLARVRDELGWITVWLFFIWITFLVNVIHKW